jgi:hypothetical protein
MVNANLGPDYQLGQRLANIERQLQALATTPVLLHASTGQNTNQPGIATDINGLHAFDSTGTETVTISGADGSVTIRGTLSLPNGSINNAALVSPAIFGQSSTSQTNFALGATDTTLASGSIAVPAGYSQALVFVIVSVGVVNPNTASDFIYTKAAINGSLSNESFGYVAGSNGSVETMSAKSQILTGLSGGSISVALTCHAQTNAFAAQSANRAYVDAQAVFLR